MQQGMDRIMLKIDEAILKIEYWLENAKKQKNLICNRVEMDVFNKPG